MGYFKKIIYCLTISALSSIAQAESDSLLSELTFCPIEMQCAMRRVDEYKASLSDQATFKIMNYISKLIEEDTLEAARDLNVIFFSGLFKYSTRQATAEESRILVNGIAKTVYKSTDVQNVSFLPSIKHSKEFKEHTQIVDTIRATVQKLQGVTLTDEHKASAINYVVSDNDSPLRRLAAEATLNVVGSSEWFKTPNKKALDLFNEFCNGSNTGKELFPSVENSIIKEQNSKLKCNRVEQIRK